MKKTILLLATGLVLSSCSSQNKKSNSTFMKGFFTYYNTLFNSKDALETELNTRKTSYKDNYYTPYIQLLKYDEQPLGDVADVTVSNSNSENNKSGSGFGVAPGGPRNSFNPKSNGATILQISEAKALKAISKYSVIQNGQEKNKTIFDAYLLLAQSRLYMNKPLEALDALNTIFSTMSKDKRLPLAKVYQAQAYAKMEDYYRANEIFSELKDTPKVKKAYQKLASLYYSEMLLKYGKKEQAIDELNLAFKLNKDKELRSRISYLKGQILQSMGRNDEASESFAKAYKYSRDPEFEVKSQIAIAKSFDPKTDHYEEVKKQIESISKKGIYGSKKNEFYYALGLLAKKQGNAEEADSYFRKSLKEKVSDPQIRGLDFYEIGKSYFDKSDYLPAGAYYDSALASMTYAPAKVILKEQTENIKKVTINYYLVKKNDSILALTKMPESERIAYFNKFIDKLKAKEEIEAAKLRQEERNKGFDTGDYSANSIFGGGGNSGFQDLGGNGKGGSNTFYFANQTTVSKGISSFKQIWGNRTLADNWRYSAKSGGSIEDLKNQAMGIASAPDPRRHDPNFYIEQIPKDEKVLSQLKKDRDTASLGLGRMYDDFFGDTKLATKTLYDLVDAKPEDDVKLQALYMIFSMNYQKDPQAAERAKQMILSDFPYTSYAEYVKNPLNNSFNKSSEEVAKAYSDAFDLYAQGKYDESKKLIEDALAKYPKDALVPKFALLNAFNTGKTAGKEVMILQLEQIALNYAKTPEGIKAKEMLNYLKSDLNIEMTDDQGNKVQNPPQTTAVEETKKEPELPKEQQDLRTPSRPGSPNDFKEH